MAHRLDPLSALLLDQRQRWQRGDRVTVETYLRQQPALRSNPEGLLDLITNEVLLCEKHGKAPRLDDYLRRFPQLAEELRLLFEVHRTIESGQTDDSLATPGPEDVTPAPTPAADAHPATAGDLIARIRASGVLLQESLAELVGPLADRFAEPRALAGELVKRGWLTPFQVNQLFLDRGRQLVLGPYVLLDRLGEGGMGRVFKARDKRLGRVVALKVIRKERLADPDAVRRFRTEVQAVARLTHPNIVHAYDADQAGDAHFLVMEFVAGVDLARLVKERGPLPARDACEYVRQAALGLQHAFEQGLVHRDVKPQNLLLSAAGGVVKVLDLGLARLRREEGSDSNTALTGEGGVVGTPDYMAPEQFEDAHEVDVRADLYSLGCTLYFLLAGRAPFAGGPLAQKIRKHQQAEPGALESLRQDLLPGVSAVVGKLMAKRQEDRYQTPAEAAAALASVLAGERPEVSASPA